MPPRTMNMAGREEMEIQRNEPDAGGSMVTTAGDYARFLAGILNAEGQRKATVDEMLQPQIAINYKRMFGPDAWTMTDENQNIHLAWGLGWGRFDTPYGRAFFHTGNGIGWQNYTVTYIDKGIGIVMLSNSDNFESVAEEIAKKAIGDIYSPYDWLGYVPFDPAAREKAPLRPIRSPSKWIRRSWQLMLAPMTCSQPPFSRSSSKITACLCDLKMGKAGSRCRLKPRRVSLSREEDYRFTFVRDSAGTVTALQLECQGIQMPLAKKVE